MASALFNLLPGSEFGEILKPNFGNIAMAYDDNTTHPALTREIIDFYELTGGKKLTDEQKQWIVQGSKDEDRAPRWINHFYDPVFNRGLDDASVFAIYGIAGYPANKWAQFSSYQTLSPGNIANLWTGKGPVISGSWWGDFSYEAAVKDYSEDKEKEAYLALGHILHLIEDMTVPEHTRNDAHPGGNKPSYYENWTKDNSAGLTQELGKRLFVKGNKPVIYSDLDSYFNSLATYTNTHFFSPNTINSEIYRKPKIVFDDGTFAYGKDENGELFDLAIIKTDIKSGKKHYLIKDEQYQILQEYWLRLSRQAVINGAGVMELFMKEAELAKKQNGEGKNGLEQSFLSQIYAFFTNPSAPKDEPALIIDSKSSRPAPKIIKQEAAVKPVVVQKIAPATPTPALTPQNQAPQSAPPMIYGGGGNSGGGSGSTLLVANNGGGSNSNNQPPATQQNNQTQNAATTTENNLNIPTFQAGDLAINEIMYDLEGSDTLSGKSREWIEVYNNSGREITLTGGSGGWRFNDGSNHLLNEPAAQGSMVIPAGGYAILAGDAALFLADHSGFGGTIIDTVMSLKNTSATLKISVSDGTIIDELTYDSSWGANGNGKTLERKSASGGSNDSANWAQSSAPGGTPGAANNWELSTSDVDNSASSTITISQAGLGTDVVATTTITENTTWTLAGSPYRLFFDGQKRPTVAAGIALTIEPGVKIIPQGSGATAMEIQGVLNAVGTAVAPIIFTSIADADDSASTTPQKGDWLNIAFTQGSQVNLDYVEFRYGGQGNTLPLREMVDIAGATVNINHSKFENSQNTALHLVDSSGTVENSIFSGNNCGISVDSLNGVANTAYNGCYGIHTTGQILSSTGLQIKNNQFIRNQLIGVEVRSGTAPAIDSNIFTDNGYPIKIENSYPIITNSQLTNSVPSTSSGQATSTYLGGIAISGYTHFSQNYTLKNNPQLPYIFETNGPDLSPYIDSGVTLTLEPGSVFKTGHTFTALNVNGNLIASTTPDNPIIFTSLKDDVRGGDTNGDGSITSPQDNDWANINFLAGSIGNFINNFFSYAGFGFIPHNLPPTNTLAKDFSAVAVSGVNPTATSSQWMAEHSYNFNKIIIHKFSTANPENFSYKIGIKDFRNDFIAAVDLSNLQNISESELTVAVQGQFSAGEKYYAAIETNDSFSVGQDADGKLAVAFYELAPGLPANPALSIDSGATVVVQ